MPNLAYAPVAVWMYGPKNQDMRMYDCKTTQKCLLFLAILSIADTQGSAMLTQCKL